MALVTAANAALAEDGVTKDTIKIGAFGPLSGPYYIFDDLVMDGAEMIYRMVNENGGIYGRKIEFVREDDRCDSQTGIATVKKLIYDEKVFMIHGGGCTKPAVAAYPGIVEAKTIGIVFTNDPWGRDRIVAVHDFMKKKGLTAAVEAEMTQDANDATPQVLQMKAAGIDTVLLVVFPKPAAVFVRDSAKLAFKPLMIGTTATAGLDKMRDLVGMGDAPMQNVVAINHVGFTEEETPNLAWEKVFKQYFPQKAWTVYPLFGIPSVVVVVLRRAGPDLTRESFRQAMDHMQGYFTGVYSGLITCC